MRSRARIYTRAAIAGLAALTAACSTATSSPTSDRSDMLVLADAQPLGEYNPINGYGELGVSPLYDGLLRPQSQSDNTIPELVPALAASQPISNPDHTVWDVALREGVNFHDGTPLDAGDVVATYRSVLDPGTGSEIAASYDMIDTVTAVDELHVQFVLRYPYADFPARLLLGIAPSELIADGPARDSQLNTRPVGTGPYTLTELRPDQAVFKANPNYWAGEPEVTNLVLTYEPDDNTRAQHMRSGALSGTVIPPLLASSFTDPAVSIVAVRTADWRGVSLPSTNPFTSDERARIALNIGVDRDSIIEHVLAGYGEPASTPFNDVYGDSYNPHAAFDYAPEEAKRILDDAGWIPAADGIRTKGSHRAEFTLMYPASDTTRRDLAHAFASAVQPLGIDVSLHGATWDEIERHAQSAAILLGGGDKPYSIDTQVYETLHSRSPNTPTYSNPANFTIPGVDEALESARRSTDPHVRTAAYQQVQDAYIQHPTHVFLAFLDHTYATTDNTWDTGPLVLEPHTHGTTWGPWWNVARWQR
ncbi:ABC transporter substrate-binding protein [Rhodococcus pyridinivorans]|jgi:peptide/nickel transport system substrate-binding protein|uniref:ABC transporter substrate-binding protein n=2 Tax=Rhodococcus pyridinivorans TaxID=103816 RepID=UPI00110D6505|nr:ABC transporter substrate-binding protein [Rhodococcus pyridinivorans]